MGIARVATFISNLFQNPPSPKLQACATTDAGHITHQVNNSGDHVKRIQKALSMIGGIDRAVAAQTTGESFAKESANGIYGPATASTIAMPGLLRRDLPMCRALSYSSRAERPPGPSVKPA